MPLDATRLIAVEFQAPAGGAFDLSVTDVAFTPAGTFGPHPVELCPDVAFDPTPMPSLPHSSPVTFTIDASNAAKRHPVSPLIYGRNGAAWSPTQSLTKEFRRLGHTLLRIEAGSNTLYNWEISAGNNG